MTKKNLVMPKKNYKKVGMFVRVSAELKEKAQIYSIQNKKSLASLIDLALEQILSQETNLKQ